MIFASLEGSVVSFRIRFTLILTFIVGFSARPSGIFRGASPVAVIVVSIAGVGIAARSRASSTTTLADGGLASHVAAISRREVSLDFFDGVGAVVTTALDQRHLSRCIVGASCHVGLFLDVFFRATARSSVSLRLATTHGRVLVGDVGGHYIVVGMKERRWKVAA